jgi:hypothetical protein
MRIMKTARCVMLFALLSAVIAAAAGEGIDQEILLIGNDESLMTLPAPQEPLWPSFPPIFPIRPVFRFLPPIFPPLGDWMTVLTGQFPLSPKEDGSAILP